jgi:hypothetical protein
MKSLVYAIFLGDCDNFSALLIDVEKNTFFYLQYYEKRAGKNHIRF